ncbi:MAG TPA: NAD-dependent epimerase/dehydratase family protein [Solirubrobacterales bacterium]|nr:NAD-dependent epimerase/dehydratase family protein [Solirubrobacterales bacterium]
MNTPERSPARRVLITGLSHYWGGRLAQALESFPEIETIIGVDTREPTRELERTEFVKVGNQHSLIQRIVKAAEIDTVIDTRLVVDSIASSRAAAHENNVIGTLNILAACTGAESPVRRFIFKSSAHWYGCEQDDPAFFTEQMRRKHAPQTPIERDIVEAEAVVTDFAEKRIDATVTVLRFANVLGPSVETSHVRMFNLPVVPMILGFDPRYQFVHEDDVVHALEHAALFDLPGIYNVAADGVLALSEVISLLGKRPLPVLPPWGTGLAAGPLRRLGFRVPDEMLNQMRFGRGVDNRRFKAAGFSYRYTSREAVLRLGEHLRLKPVLAGKAEPYRYEREVEEFLRWSPHVRREAANPRIDDAGLFDPSPPPGEGEVDVAEAPPQPVEETPSEEESDLDAPAPEPMPRAETDVPDPGLLEQEEVIALLAGLDVEALGELEQMERDGQSREAVLEAIAGARGYLRG